MNDQAIFHTTTWYPFKHLGLTHPFWEVNGDTLFYTWIVCGIIAALCIVGRKALNNPDSIPGYMALLYAKTFRTMVEQSLEKKAPEVYCSWITALFTFIALCNTIILLPGCEEPSKDLNTTFALSLLSFFFIQKETIKAHGIGTYIGHYIKFPLPFIPEKITPLSALSIPFRCIINTVAALFGLPLEIMSKCATIISMAFRLFGNILGGSLITLIFKQGVAKATIIQLFVLASGFSLVISLFFGLFEGLIQAFVFAVISLTYLALGIQHE